MDEYFELFLETFGPPIERRFVPKSSIERYRGKLPNQLLEYWQEHGWCGYAQGLYWTVNPQEYEPALEAWIGSTPFMESDAYHVIARGAFGDLVFWGEKTGTSLSIIPAYALAFPTDGYSELISQGQADEAVRQYFAIEGRDSFNLTGKDERPLFERTLQRLGQLKHDEMYGFVPALALGGPATLEHLEKVKAVEHLVLLAQLSELRVMKNPLV